MSKKRRKERKGQREVPNHHETAATLVKQAASLRQHQGFQGGGALVLSKAKQKQKKESRVRRVSTTKSE